MINELGDFPGQSVIPQKLQAIASKVLNDGYLIHVFLPGDPSRTPSMSTTLPSTSTQPPPASSSNAQPSTSGLQSHRDRLIHVPIDGSKPLHPSLAAIVTRKLEYIGKLFRVVYLQFTRSRPPAEQSFFVLHFQHPLVIRVLIVGLIGFITEFPHLRDQFGTIKRMSRFGLASSEGYVGANQFDICDCVLILFPIQDIGMVHSGAVRNHTQLAYYSWRSR